MPRRKRSPPLSEQRVLDAALAIVDVEGLDALSMRRLGASLGVDPMAVYHYVPGKQELLRRLAERAFSGVQVPEAGGDWRSRLRAWADAYRQAALAHPNLALQALADPQVVMAAAVRVSEGLYQLLEDAGLGPAHVIATASLLVDYLNGSLLASLPGTTVSGPPATSDGGPTTLTEELERHPGDAFPVQRRILAAAGEPAVDDLTPALDVIIAGVEALAASDWGASQ